MSPSKTVAMLQNIDSNDQASIGRSIGILARFAQEKLPVAPGFVISALGFNQVLDFTDLKKYYDNSKKTSDYYHKNLKEAFSIIEIPTLVAQEVKRAYAKISGFSDAYVNLRALILDKSGQEISHRTFVVFDVRGEKVLLENIKNLYKEVIFENTDLVIKFFEGELSIVILAQKALQSEASGLMFTTDIITNDSNKLVIEAVYGLESIVNYEPIIPDQYIYDKSSGQIVEKHITTQEFMAVRQIGGGKSEIQKVKISPAWQKRQKLDDKHIYTLAKTGAIIEEGMSEPQQILWSFESGKVWINFIESTNKITLNKSNAKNLQKQIDEEIFASTSSEVDHKGTGISMFFPEEVQEQKDIVLDVFIKDKNQAPVVSSPEVTQIAQNHNAVQTEIYDKFEKLDLKENNKTAMSATEEKKINKEPLLIGKYYVGTSIQGEVCFEPSLCKKNSILVLGGDEDIPAAIELAGFIIEDESELLATRLHEYFEVPVITGVPLVRKILKPGEVIQIDGDTGHIYETIPFTEQVGEIEMNFVAKQNEKVESASLTIPVNKLDNNLQIHTEVSDLQENQGSSPSVMEEFGEKSNATTFSDLQEVVSGANVSSAAKELRKGSTSSLTLDDINISLNDTSNRDQFEAKVDVKTKAEPKLDSQATEPESISKLLDLVDEGEPDIFDLKKEDKAKEKEVDGISAKDQFSIWGKSLEKIITASKSIAPDVAVDALEHVIDDNVEITQNTKEIAFDTDQSYIKEKIEEVEPPALKEVPFVPTATKVYINLVDETLNEGFHNFDGLIFSSSFDQDLYFEVLEDILAKSEGKEVLVVCPPYETVALTRFLQKIYELRNNGMRNLSVILPDYRNKKEIAEFKKLLSSINLRRSSTFEIFANVSRTINVFRLAELNESIIDGAFIDLFRLKMNMLGVEKLTASTKYVEGMKSMVDYISKNLKIEGKTIIDITGFANPDKVLEHVYPYGFWGISCGITTADSVKKEVALLEKNHIRLSNPASFRKGVKRK